MEISEVCETFHWKLSKVQLFLELRNGITMPFNSTEEDFTIPKLPGRETGGVLEGSIEGTVRVNAGGTA